MRKHLMIGLAALSIGAAEPAPPEAALPVVTGSGLTVDQLWAAWPAAARSIGLEARVDVRCVITVEGVAENCSAKTDLLNLGFESAAIGLVQSLRFTPATRAGQRVPLTIPISVPFGCGKTLCTPYETDKKAPANLVPFPTWTKTPSAAEIEAAYPKAALAERVEGVATLLCRRLPTGAIEQCRVTDETPAGKGFGDAALPLAGSFAGPVQKAPALVRATVRFRSGPGRSSAVTFDEGERPPLASPPDPPPAKTLPKYSGVQRFYPREAARRGLNGEAMLICRVQPDESVSDCAVASETPAGMGFGAAALQMSPFFRAGPRIVDGKIFRDDYLVVPSVFRIAQ